MPITGDQPIQRLGEPRQRPAHRDSPENAPRGRRRGEGSRDRCGAVVTGAGLDPPHARFDIVRAQALGLTEEVDAANDDDVTS